MPTPPAEATESEQVLRDRSAGGRAIRGGALRVAGYGVGMALTAAASVALLRYLGVEDFGRYATVVALIAIVQGVTDAGLNVVGQREYVLRPTAEAQRELVADVVGIRLVLTPVGVALAAAFAVLAGYDAAMVAGTLLAGAGLMIANAAVSLTLPLSATLRLGWVTAIDVGRQVATVAGIVALVVLGAALAPFFAVHILAALTALAMTLVALRGAALTGPRFQWRRWRPLLIAAAPIAASLVLNVVYLRTLLVMMSLLASETETGLFATSFRIVEVFLGVPILMVGAAFPILVHAGADDEARLVYALRRLTEASLLVAAGLVLVLALAAEPIVLALGGEQYRDAGPVLALQALVLLPAFLTQVFAFALVSIHRQRAVVTINAVALVSVLALGPLLIPLAGSTGAAAAAVVGEAALALTAAVLLARARPGLRPQAAPLLRIGAAAAVATAAGLIPGVPAAAAAALAAAVYLLAAWRLRAIPAELVALLPGRRAQADSSS